MEQIPKQETIALREKLIGKSCQLFFRDDPLKIVRGVGQYLYDENGDQYLDCINNVAHVGHCHPAVVEAGCNQMSTLNTNNRFLHDNIVLCAQRIISTMPEELSVCFFVNSGSEANDLALRLAQIHTKNKDIIALEHAYHGHLTSLIDISHYKFNLPGGVGKRDHVHVASIPDTYRGKFRDTDYPIEKIASLYSNEIKDICDNVQKHDKGICAYIAESLISCGGQVIPPQNYMKEVYEYVRAAGGVCIADEVQVGFGRLGKWWGFQLHNVVPDIVTMGKPMGNGHPIAAIVTTPQIAESFLRTGVEYFNTYGGNPVSCAIANAVFDTIIKENLHEHAKTIGNYLLEKCMTLAKKYKRIGDVRGVGLFLGLEMVKDRNTRVPDTEGAAYIVGRMKDKFILVSKDGPHCNVIKVKPPMVFTKENVDELVLALDASLKELSEENQDSDNSVTSSSIPEMAVGKETRPPRKSSSERIKSI